MSKLAVKIAVIESERNWGRRIDDYMVCLSTEDALNFKEEFNSRNTLETVPDWYMICEGNPTPIDLSDEQYNLLEKSGRMWLGCLEKH